MSIGIFEILIIELLILIFGLFKFETFVRLSFNSEIVVLKLIFLLLWL